MALRKELTDRHRAAIKTDAILKRLHAFVLEDHDMKATQVRAALGLLAKTVPDLKAVEIDLQGEVGGAILISTQGVDPEVGEE